MTTLYISKSFASESDTTSQPSFSDDRVTASTAPSQIRLTSGSPFGIEDIFLDLGANNYAPSQIQLNFLDSQTFEKTISLLDNYYPDPRQAISSQSPIFNAMGSGSVLFPKGTSLEQVKNSLLAAYPDYKAISVATNKNNQAIPKTGEIAYIYFRKNLDSVAGEVEKETQKHLTGTAKKADVFELTGTPEFGAVTADRITNFNPKEKDKVQIDVSNFGSNAAGTFKIANNSKALTKALASTTDFIYLKSTGELYYNENGKLPGYGDGGIFAIIENKANITTKNVEFL